MEWLVPFSLILGSLLLLMAISVPVAFSFLFVTVVGIAILQGLNGLLQLPLSIVSSISTFALIPIPLFIFMGVVLWHSNLAQQAVDALDKLLGRLPGRLALLTIASGSVFSALSGSTMANTAMLGTLLLPELRKRGYSRDLSMGPIMAGGGLAMMIPPSALAVILASIAKLSVAKVLVAGIVPGVIMAILYTFYIIGRSVTDPRAAPAYEVTMASWAETICGVALNLLPLGFVIFSVTGLIVVGIATPTEAAALGALSSLVLAAFYRRFSVKLLQTALMESMRITVMSFAIIATAISFSQLLAFSGATRGFLEAVLSAKVSPLMLMFGTQLIVLILGCFMEQISIMLITLPIFMPLVAALHFDPIWFAVLMLVNLETALMTPPLGLLLVVMKGVAPPETTFGQIWIAAAPYVICNIIVIVFLLVFPEAITAVVHF